MASLWNYENECYFTYPFGADNDRVDINELEYCYWLDETPEDQVISSIKQSINASSSDSYNRIKQKADDLTYWALLEEKFKKEYFKRTLANNAMNFWEIVQFFKDNI